MTNLYTKLELLQKHLDERIAELLEQERVEEAFGVAETKGMVEGVVLAHTSDEATNDLSHHLKSEILREGLGDLFPTGEIKV